MNRLSHIKFIVSPWCTDLDKNTGSQTKWSIVISAMCSWLVYSNENSRCSSSTTVACINSAAFMVNRPVLKSNLHPVFEVLPLASVTSEWRYGLTHPQLQSDSQIILFVCFICRSRLRPRFRCIPSIYHVNTLFIYLFTYLLIYSPYFVYLLKTCLSVNYHVFIYLLFII